MIVENSLDVLKTYKKALKTEKLEVIDYEKGLNKVIFTIQNTKFHIR